MKFVGICDARVFHQESIVKRAVEYRNTLLIQPLKEHLVVITWYSLILSTTFTLFDPDVSMFSGAAVVVALPALNLKKTMVIPMQEAVTLGQQRIRVLLAVFMEKILP